MRPGHLLLISLIALLGLLLAGCGTPAAAPAPPTATPVPATVTATPAPTTVTVAPVPTVVPTNTTPPQPPTDTPIPAPTNTPTLIPTVTPVPLDIVTHTVPFVDEGSGTAGLTVASAVHHHVATLLGSAMRLVDTTSGTVQGPITVTTDTLNTTTQGSTDVALLTDDAHARADVLIDGENVTTATLTTIDLDSARILRRRVLPQLPLANIYTAVAVPATGDVLVELNDVYSVVGAGETPARLVRLSADGSVRRTRLLGDISTEGSLTLDAPAGRVLLSVTGIDTATITAYDLRTLTPTWSANLPYKPAATVVDSSRGRLWLLAPGGRATITDIRSGQTVATCDPGYSKPAVWDGNNDLVVDPRTGLGYTSWTGGADYSGNHTAIDVIDPARHTRTILTPDGGVLALATATTDRLIGLDSANDLVLRSTRDGHALAVVAPGASFSDDITPLSGSTVKYLTLAQDGPTITIARAQNVPYQNTITGASTASGVVALTLHDRP